MTNISALDALNAALAASDTVKEQAAASNDTTIDFSSYLKSSKNLDEIYQEASQTYGVSVDLLKAMTKQESNFNPNATSRSGAQGLMQIIPRYSASRMAKLGVTNLYDPASNILVGIDLLAEYYHTYGSWNQALTAYRTGNAGSDSAYAATILGSVGMFQTVYYE